ncbi:hypothetical protein LEP3755_14320 [Leptolyngbya sp. NIES-3755]|nr:hypothetical protein LEP3755_14320 [Leptolyngbya sp. NIES-3755]
MKPVLTIASVISIAVVAASSSPNPAQAFPPAPAGCVYLNEITTGRPVIRKTVATNNSNANTDFAVPTGRQFRSYIGRLIPENNSRFTAQVNLKYNDGSSSTAVTRTIEARRFFMYNQPFQTPTDRQPFQINTRVTGNRNTAYQVAVLACP